MTAPATTETMTAGGTTASGSTVLEEKLDPNYEPTDDDIHAYATWLGMDLPLDRPFLWLAREALMAPLPPAWKPCRTNDTQEIYYFNFATGESLWDHPCDTEYRRLYHEYKATAPAPSA